MFESEWYTQWTDPVPAFYKEHDDGFTVRLGTEGDYKRYQVVDGLVTLVATQGGEDPWKQFDLLSAPYYGEFRRVDAEAQNWGLIANFYQRPDPIPSDIWESDTWPPDDSPGDPEPEPTTETPMISVVSPGETTTIVFKSEVGVTYRFQRSLDLVEWESLLEVITGDGSVVRRTFESTDSAAYFRLVVSE